MMALVPHCTQFLESVEMHKNHRTSLLRTSHGPTIIGYTFDHLEHRYIVQAEMEAEMEAEKRHSKRLDHHETPKKMQLLLETARCRLGQGMVHTMSYSQSVHDLWIEVSCLSLGNWIVWACLTWAMDSPR